MSENVKSSVDPVTGFAKGRGKETLFRVSARNQIELIAIADNKANIIIGINVILISLIIAFLGSNFSVDGAPLMMKPEVAAPFAILMISCLVSAVFSILAAKPQIIKTKTGNASSKLFFQNFYNESLDEYKEDMYTVMGSKKLIYDQLIIDMYHNGLVLKLKYSQLSKSYNVFMYGLVVAVVVFAVLSFVL